MQRFTVWALRRGNPPFPLTCEATSTYDSGMRFFLGLLGVVGFLYIGYGFALGGRPSGVEVLLSLVVTTTGFGLAAVVDALERLRLSSSPRHQPHDNSGDPAFTRAR